MLEKLKNWKNRKFPPKIKLEDTAILYRQLFALLDSGVHLGKIFFALRDDASNPHLKEIITDIYVQVQHGAALSAAFSKHPKIFSPLHIAMIKCGEKSGSLSNIMNELADAQEKDLKLIRKIKTSLIYPTITLFFSILILVLIMRYIFPAFIPVFKTLNVRLPLTTKLLMNFSIFISTPLYFFITIVFCGALLYSISAFIKTPNGKLFLESVLIRMPIYKSLFPTVAVTRFCRNLRLLYLSGNPIISSLSVIKEIIGNYLYEKKLEVAIENLRNGDSLSEALRSIDLFPRVLISMIVIGETTATLPKALDSVSKFYEFEIEAALEKLTHLIEPFLILILGAIISVIILSIFMPLYNVIENIGA